MQYGHCTAAERIVNFFPCGLVHIAIDALAGFKARDVPQTVDMGKRQRRSNDVNVPVPRD